MIFHYQFAFERKIIIFTFKIITKNNCLPNTSNYILKFQLIFISIKIITYQAFRNLQHSLLVWHKYSIWLLQMRKIYLYLVGKQGLLQIFEQVANILEIKFIVSLINSNIRFLQMRKIYIYLVGKLDWLCYLNNCKYSLAIRFIVRLIDYSVRFPRNRKREG